jgi:hypothetical protein
MNSRIWLSFMRMLMNVQKQLRTYDTLLPSIFTGMEKRWMRWLVQEKRGCMIDCGCIHDSDQAWTCNLQGCCPHVLFINAQHFLFSSQSWINRVFPSLVWYWNWKARTMLSWSAFLLTSLPVRCRLCIFTFRGLFLSIVICLVSSCSIHVCWEWSTGHAYWCKVLHQIGSLLRPFVYTKTENKLNYIGK